MRRRLLIDSSIVVAALAVLAMPYLLPEPTRPVTNRSRSVAYCLHFEMPTNPITSSDIRNPRQSFWSGSITVSNAGPHAVELLSAEIISRSGAGTETWRTSLVGPLLRRGAATTLAVQLPTHGDATNQPRVWELHGNYRTRLSEFNRYLTMLQDGLPRHPRLFNLPQVWQGDFTARWPKNFDSVLTNDLGWRLKVVAKGMLHGGLLREWRPAVEAATALQREMVERLVTTYRGKMFILTAVATTPSMGAMTNQVPEIETIKGDLAFYCGWLDGTTEEGIRIRAVVPSESGRYETVEVRTADILGFRSILGDVDSALRLEMESWLGQREMKSWLGQPDGAANASQPIRPEASPTSSAAGSRR
jgi:hypothetical protein